MGVGDALIKNTVQLLRWAIIGDLDKLIVIQEKESIFIVIEMNIHFEIYWKCFNIHRDIIFCYSLLNQFSHNHKNYNNYSHW
jgi:hypothetical protein